MDKALIFGSQGFIGSHLAHYLAERGWQVTGTDIAPPHDGSKYRFIPARQDAEFFHDIFAESYDVCINCAGAASVPLSFEEPLQDFELNSCLVFKILSAIKRSQTQSRFINLSSAAVYGNPERLPIVETQPCRPISPYGYHKHLSELICQEFSELFGLQTTSVRVFSAYGPGLRKQLFWDIFQKAQQLSQIELFGSGFETRDFIHIDDLVRAIEVVAQQPRLEFRAINVASGQESTIEEVASIFCNRFPSPRTYRFTGVEKQGDPSRWVADIGVLESMGFQPSISLDEGITGYIEWLAGQNQILKAGVPT